MTTTEVRATTAEDASVREQALRERAIKQLKKRRDLTAHAIVYVLFNGFVVIIWAVTGQGFFWPIFLMVPWGIGLVMNAFDVYRGNEFNEDEIAREMNRLQTGR